MQKKISIIVPVYNAEEYLTKCLDSLVNQTLSAIEIILIDDCSNDRSREIIDDYYNKYSDKIIPILLSENRKQGFARNRGIDISTGEYIVFVDSDDYIAEDMCEVLYKKAKEKDYDIVCFDMVDVIDGIYKSNKLSYTSKIDGDIDYKKRNLLLNSRGYFTTRMYKRDLLVCNNIKFPEGIFYEDSPFNTLSILYAKSVAKIDKEFYYYIKRTNSSSNCKNKERLYHRIDTIEFMINEVKSRGLYTQYKSIIEEKYLKMLVGNIHLCLSMFDNPNIDKLKKINKNLSDNIPNYSKCYEYKKLDKISKLYIRLNSYCPNLLIKVDRLYKGLTSIKNN